MLEPDSPSKAGVYQETIVLQVLLNFSFSFEMIDHYSTEVFLQIGDLCEFHFQALRLNGSVSCAIRIHYLPTRFGERRSLQLIGGHSEQAVLGPSYLWCPI